MKTKNQTERDLLELRKSSAANEDFSPQDTSATGRNQAWSPYEVWRTRVKHPVHQLTPDNTQPRS
jgi:hypothetical protein